MRPLVIEVDSTNPYRNIAVERVLLDAVEPGELVMMLWRNADTIVIGRNQNLWKECRFEEFEADGGRLARRFSGGGAVYHDLGNLNFTFLAAADELDVARNVSIICNAVRSFGLPAELTGRNDIVIDGAKFSGNAFFGTRAAKFHHGTLMVSVDASRLADYLVPDARKLASKGVSSVRSRVVNLADLDDRITTETLARALVDSLGASCGSDAEEFDSTRLDDALVAETERMLASRSWKCGENIAFTHTIDERFDWGSVAINLRVRAGCVEEARIDSDALDAALVLALSDALVGADYGRDSLADAIAQARIPSANDLVVPRESAEAMVRDCAQLVSAM